MPAKTKKTAKKKVVTKTVEKKREPAERTNDLYSYIALAVVLGALLLFGSYLM